MYQAPLILLCESMGTRLTATRIHTCTFPTMGLAGLQGDSKLSYSPGPVGCTESLPMSCIPAPTEQKFIQSSHTHTYAQPQWMRSALISICIKGYILPTRMTPVTRTGVWPSRVYVHQRSSYDDHIILPARNPFIRSRLSCAASQHV